MSAWDIGQWFTPPKGKTPWTAMTAGSIDKWAKGAEEYGPAIKAAMNFVPYVGPLLSMGGGAIGMGGRGTGFQGTDYGWEGNITPTLSGILGSSGGGYANLLSALQNSGSKRNWGVLGNGYDTEYDRSQDPTGKQFDFSQLLSTLGSMMGSKYGGSVGSSIGSSAGRNIGTKVGNQVYPQKYQLLMNSMNGR